MSRLFNCQMHLADEKLLPVGLAVFILKDGTMTLTTGLILRRITETDLSVSAYKLATIILDAIAWKDGYNGLPRGTAAFTLSALAEKMGITRQYLSALLSELAGSPLLLARYKPHGKHAPWLFRFAVFDEGSGSDDVVSTGSDTSLYSKEINKTLFAGTIEITAGTNVFQTRWAALIKGAKACLPCWNVDTQAIWERFLAFNRQRGNDSVPAGYLLGFMRRWRNVLAVRQTVQTEVVSASAVDPVQQEMLAIIQAAPVANRQFHEADLCRRIGKTVYENRITSAVERYGCARFTAMLVVHGQAVRVHEIGR